MRSATAEALASAHVRIGRLISTVVDGACPLLQGFRQEYPLRLEIHAEKETDSLDETSKPYAALALADVKEAHRADLSRRDGLIRKGHAYFAAVIGTTVGFSFQVISAMARTEPGLLLFFLRAAGGVALAYLVMAALAAAKVIGPTEAFDVYLQHRAAWVEAGDEETEKSWLVKLILLNQSYALLASTWLAAAYACLRNAFVVVFTVIFILMGSA